MSRLRSDSTDAASEDVRDKCVVMIYDALASDSNAGELWEPALKLTSDKKTIAERAIGIEREAFKMLKFNSGNEYRASACSSVGR